MDTFDKIFTIKSEYTKEDFLRKTLLKLASNVDTPIDITEAKFGEVKQRTREIIYCDAHVEMDYTASVGYDKEEEYETTENKYVPQGSYYYFQGVKNYAKQGGFYLVDIIKTRMVIDWSPFSGHIAGNAFGCAINENKQDLDYTSLKLYKIIKAVKNNSLVEEGDSRIINNALNLAKSRCESKVALEISYPGNHVKDEHTTADTLINSLYCYIMPFYEVDFTYNGKTYHASAFACGDLTITTEYPQNDISVTAQANKSTTILNIAALACLISFAVLFVLAVVMLFFETTWVCIFPVIALISAVSLNFISNKNYAKKLTSLIENSNKIKCHELENAYKKYGYAELSSDEKELFSVESSKHSADTRSTRKNKALITYICATLAAALVLASLLCQIIFDDQELHSPNQFTITLIQKTQGYEEGKYNSSKGTYYIYLTYNIKAAKIGASYMKFTTYVYDKNGNELGQFTRSFNEMNLEANSEATYTSELEIYSFSTDTFFTTLYITDYSDLTFSYEILSITYSDGHT